MKLTLINAILIVITLVIMYYIYASFYNHTYITDGRYRYYMISDIGDVNNDSAAATQFVSNANRKILRFLKILRDEYKIDSIITASDDNGVTLMESQKIVDHILDNYNPEAIIEVDPRKTSDTSYTINKGQQLHLCVRNKLPPHDLVDENTFMFVVLHEISHIGAYNVIGHPERFWQVFKFILEKAVEYGIYSPVNYEQSPINYCGLEINYNPLYDSSIAVV